MSKALFEGKTPMKKFQNILIASDIDGTLLWKSKYIHPRNFEKLRYFCENGGHFALSSGRNSKDVFVISKKLQSLINMPCILCNGSYLFDFQTQELLNPHYLDSIPLVEAFKKMKMKYEVIGFRATIEKGFLCPEEDDIAIEFLRASHLGDIAFQTPIDKFTEEKIFKAVFVSNDTIALRSLQNELYEHYEAVFDITTSDDTILEIMPKGVSKKTQFPYLKTRYPDAELWCIGDFHNDVEMLKGADIAVCPENAVDEIKKICHFQVCHCKDGALAEMIDLIEKKIDNASS